MPEIKPSHTAFADCSPEIQKNRERLVKRIVAENGHPEFWATVPQKNLPVRLFNPVEINSDVLQILLELMIVKKKLQRSETDMEEIADAYRDLILIIFLAAIILAGLTDASVEFEAWLARVDRSSIPCWISQLSSHKVTVGAIDISKILLSSGARCFRLAASLMAATGKILLGVVWLLFSLVADLPAFIVRNTLTTLTGLLIIILVVAVTVVHLSLTQAITSYQQDLKQRFPVEKLNKAISEEAGQAPAEEKNTSAALSFKEPSTREPTENLAEEM